MKTVKCYNLIKVDNIFNKEIEIKNMKSLCWWNNIKQSTTMYHRNEKCWNPGLKDIPTELLKHGNSKTHEIF